MTKENAILCLKGMKNYARDTFTEQTDWQTSLDMAIKALEQEPCEDAISRQTVLDILKHAKENGIVRITVPYLERTIESLPSITPKAEGSGEE